ncbi:MAG: DNA alkylation repair protein, partial [Planctomycetes bacterium]|nr:DNA alkylation repair protein [Planctomycetota bacterium]
MTSKEILKELQALGNDGYKRVMLKHGVPEPVWGVKIEELKKFQKRIKVDYQLALDLFDSGVSDAMYLAGLIADDQRMTKKDLQKWVKQARCSMHSEYTVPWVAAGSSWGWELALEWIDSKAENVASA